MMNTVLLMLLLYNIIKNKQEKTLKELSKLKPYYQHFNWTNTNFPAGLKEWKQFEKNNPDISLNILSVSLEEEKINIEYA